MLYTVSLDIVTAEYTIHHVLYIMSLVAIYVHVDTI